MPKSKLKKIASLALCITVGAGIFASGDIIIPGFIISKIYVSSQKKTPVSSLEKRLMHPPVKSDTLIALKKETKYIMSYNTEVKEPIQEASYPLAYNYT